MNAAFDLNAQRGYNAESRDFLAVSPRANKGIPRTTRQGRRARQLSAPFQEAMFAVEGMEGARPRQASDSQVSIASTVLYQHDSDRCARQYPPQYQCPGQEAGGGLSPCL